MRGHRTLIASLLVGAAPAAAATLESLAVAPAGPAVTVTLGFDGAFLAPSVFAMRAPPRLVIDLPDTRTTPRRASGGGGVNAARAAQFSATQARVVVDLAQPMRVSGAAAGERSLTLTLTGASSTAFGSLVAKGRVLLPAAVDGLAAAGMQSLGSAVAGAASATRDVAPAAPASPVARIEPAIAVPAARSGADGAAQPAAAPGSALQDLQPSVATQLPSTAKPAFAAAAENLEAAAENIASVAAPLRAVRPIRPSARPLVVIDAGHGGHDVGAISVLEGRREKDVTLAIARAVARQVEAAGFRVLLTRADDRFIPLPERVRIAQAARASLFISIHADSAPATDARGATVYTLSEVASDREAARLAAKENKSDVIGGFGLAAESADVADILISLARRETMNVSAEFAAVLQREMAPEVYFKSNAHRFAGFRVLKAADVPSVLLETGYLSNIDDSRFLFSEAGQRAIAKGVRDAVEAHFNRRIAQR